MKNALLLALVLLSCSTARAIYFDDEGIPEGYRGFADFSVETKGYLELSDYHDLKNAKEVLINGIPEREYIYRDSEICISGGYSHQRLSFASHNRFPGTVVRVLGHQGKGQHTEEGLHGPGGGVHLPVIVFCDHCCLIHWGVRMIGNDGTDKRHPICFVLRYF